MKEETSPRNLSKLDWFSIIAGIIGLVTDLGTISAVFIAAEGSSSIPITIWVISLISILITTIVIDFFSRRYFVLRIQSKSRSFTKSEFDRVESGVGSIVLIVCLPLLILYSVFAAFEINSTLPEASQSIVAAIFLGLIVGFIVGFIICWIIDSLVLDIYAAFDTRYVLFKKDGSAY